MFQAEYGIRGAQESRGLGDVYKRQTHLYRGRNLIGSFDEAVQTAFVVALVAIAAGAPMLFVTEFPRGLVISVPPSALILMSTGRWIFRASRERYQPCLLYTSDAADDLLCVNLGGRRNIKKKKHSIRHPHLIVVQT